MNVAQPLMRRLVCITEIVVRRVMDPALLGRP
jgi:hypothetical protein